MEHQAVEVEPRRRELGRGKLDKRELAVASGRGRQTGKRCSATVELVP